MTASFPNLNRTYSHVPAAPLAAAATMYTPIGGGFASPAKSNATSVAPAMADRPWARISMTGSYHG